MVRRWCAVFAVGMALAGPAQAQDWKGMGRLEGKVLDAQGAPIAGASVKLEREGYGDGTTVKTDKKGRWAIAGITAATWNADIEAPGYALKRISIPLPSESARLAPVEVRLDKAAAAGPAPEAVQALEKGEAAYKEGRFPEARAEFEKLLALRPDLATTIHQRIGFAYIQEKEYVKGLDHLQKVLDAEPANATVRGIMAQAALEGGMLDRGMELLAGIDESSVTNPDLFFNIGVNLVNANKPEDAIGYFTKAVTLDPAYADGYFRRGLAYMGVGKMAEAKADFNKLLELKPTGPEADLARKAVEQIK
ncbi:MAG TPA: tetratricopeptide repeat protein [Vicinamibacteria bacterium]|nr:tetratricopeptide repeat protein [Vicinamibacteria bacterium]